MNRKAGAQGDDMVCSGLAESWQVAERCCVFPAVSHTPFKYLDHKWNGWRHLLRWNIIALWGIFLFSFYPSLFPQVDSWSVGWWINMELCTESARQTRIWLGIKNLLCHWEEGDMLSCSEKTHYKPWKRQGSLHMMVRRTHPKGSNSIDGVEKDKNSSFTKSYGNFCWECSIRLSPTSESSFHQL